MEHKICSVANQELLWLRPSARREKNKALSAKNYFTLELSRFFSGARLY